VHCTVQTTGLILPAAMLLITALARHWWMIRRIRNETDDRIKKAISELDRYGGIGKTLP
jgi:hypothetical protein